jgi:MOSC domain-containing protein YiiM
MGLVTINSPSSLSRLLDAPQRPGRITWIGLRPARREPMQPVAAAVLEAGRGLVGDRYSRLDGGRQVTLIEGEALSSIASYLGLACVTPAELRRNIVTQGINLMALKGRRFRLGEAVLETSGECHPCSRMEEALGIGGYNAVRGRGGITARVVTSGRVLVGDMIGIETPLAASG